MAPLYQRFRFVNDRDDRAAPSFYQKRKEGGKEEKRKVVKASDKPAPKAKATKAKGPPKSELKQENWFVENYVPGNSILLIIISFFYYGNTVRFY